MKTFLLSYLRRSKYFALIAVVVFLTGIGSLSLAASRLDVSASLLRSQQAANMRLQNRLLQKSRAASSSSRINFSVGTFKQTALCSSGQECLASNGAPPCLNVSTNKCSVAYKGRKCGTRGVTTYNCFACPSQARLDSSHHRCK